MVTTQGAQGAQEAPVFVAETTTPSGIEIRYAVEPKRKYEIRSLRDDDRWREVVSITTALEVLDKPALPWWGMRVGVGGVLELIRRGIARVVEHQGQRVLAVPGPIPMVEGMQAGLIVAGVEHVERYLIEEQLTVNHIRDTAGTRGQSCHDAFEVWAKTGEKPSPAMFPKEEQGYIVGLLEFLADVPLEPEACEVMVGSLEHGFAGRYDLRGSVGVECNVVYKRTPKRGAHYAKLAPGRFLVDLKTSKGVYPSHSRQLEAYEAASVECGYEPTDYRGILHVTEDGHYEFVRSTADFSDFLPVLEVWKSDQRMKERRR